MLPATAESANTYLKGPEMLMEVMVDVSADGEWAVDWIVRGENALEWCSQTIYPDVREALRSLGAPSCAEGFYEKGQVHGATRAQAYGFVVFLLNVMPDGHTARMRFTSAPPPQPHATPR